MDSQELHPQDPPREVSVCGNTDRLKADEVFDLAPGAAKELNRWVHQWVPFPESLAPGKYRVVFYYANVPETDWVLFPLGKHDEAAMRRVKASTPISLVSNEVKLEVTK